MLNITPNNHQNLILCYNHLCHSIVVYCALFCHLSKLISLFYYFNYTGIFFEQNSNIFNILRFCQTIVRDSKTTVKCINLIRLNYCKLCIKTLQMQRYSILTFLSEKINCKGYYGRKNEHNIILRYKKSRIRIDPEK